MRNIDCHSVFKSSLIIASVIVIINIKMSLFGLGCLFVSGGEKNLYTKNSCITKKLLGRFIVFKLIVPLFSNCVLTSCCGLWLKVFGLLNQRWFCWVGKLFLLLSFFMWDFSLKHTSKTKIIDFFCCCCLLWWMPYWFGQSGLVLCFIITIFAKVTNFWVSSNRKHLGMVHNDWHVFFTYQNGKSEIFQHYNTTFCVRQFQIDVDVDSSLLYNNKADNRCLS